MKTLDGEKFRRSWKECRTIIYDLSHNGTPFKMQDNSVSIIKQLEE